MQCRNNKRTTQKRKITHAPSPTAEEEVENVEYLDECVTDEIEEVSGSAHNNLPQGFIKSETAFEDTFYPNAVHCLIALYRDKYERNMKDPKEIQSIYESVWEAISKDMRESYFEFDAQQVRHKFTQLRQQYFNVSSKKEAEEFVFFQPLHEIYNDKLIAIKVNNEKFSSRKSKHIRIYRDDVLFNSRIETETRATEERPQQTEEIIEKGPNRLVDCDVDSLVTKDKNEQSELNEIPVINLEYSKRRIPDTESDEISNSKRKTDDFNSERLNMTLADYNEAQQRRHEEKMSLLRQTLLLQERALDIQNKLLDEIVKRIK
ncbi:uncharacterized protein LOC120775393 [Bactrocera tryoni]|uniref:uncharacterized protein LOC120775393 n=1 Tax=Bactrocera tryoni TaxID=59916 RepID=UPI001A9A1D0C|nr:uncharacterized protein LOC120775393 [Bactrocera tryoni]